MAGNKTRSRPEESRSQDCATCTHRLSWEQEKHFRDLVEYSKTGIFIVQDDIVVYLNPEQQRITGPITVLNGPLPFDNIHPEDQERVIDFYTQAARGDIKDVDVDFRYFVPSDDGSETRMKWLTCRGCLIEFRGRSALLVNMVDMTRARELEHLLDTQEKMASLGRVAAGLAHEMRSPLSGINIYLSMLKKILETGDGMHKTAGILAQMQDASSRIEAVIRRVMDFSKPGEPRFVLKNINEPVDNAVSLALSTMEKADIRLEKDLAPDMPACSIDPLMITQVILNLVTNAAEAFADRKGRKIIKVSTACDKGRAIIRVSDSGPGVPALIRDKVFEPFFTTKTDSTGIGLSICSRIISDHNGDLKVAESSLGGAEFIIEIPVRPKEGR